MSISQLHPVAATTRAARAYLRRCAQSLEPISLLMDRHNHLLVGEEEQAERWGAKFATTLPLSHEH